MTFYNVCLLHHCTIGPIPKDDGKCPFCIIEEQKDEIACLQEALRKVMELCVVGTNWNEGAPGRLALTEAENALARTTHK